MTSGQSRLDLTSSDEDIKYRGDRQGVVGLKRPGLNLLGCSRKTVITLGTETPGAGTS